MGIWTALKGIKKTKGACPRGNYPKKSINLFFVRVFEISFKNLYNIGIMY